MAEGYAFRHLARTLGCAHSTISRKIKRHILDNSHGVYCHHFSSQQGKEIYFTTRTY
ncbi:helix-turn-helix domain-containing protein [Candidatus Enterovibrio escicola]|uniref:helix-turn-helix domain-containing protein n=1 Tax=Candidatus Enterovibrio escicola TaxID=1927127 RepID=UPI001238075B